MTQQVERGGPAAWRAPAHDLEPLVIARLSRHFAEQGDTLSLHHHDSRQRLAAMSIATLRDGGHQERSDLVRHFVERVDLQRERIVLALRPGTDDTPAIALEAIASLVRSGRQTRLVTSGVQQASASQRDEALVRLVVNAHAARKASCAPSDTDFAAIAADHGFTPHYFAQLARLGGLAPDIVTAIIEGRQPASLTRTKLARTKALPLDWTEQRRMFGFA